MENYNSRLILGKAIEYKKLTFYPITIGEIEDAITLDRFDDFMSPYCMTKDSIRIDDENVDNNSLNLFSDIILRDKDLLIKFVVILNLFCKSSVKAGKNGLDLVDEDENVIFTVNDDNFDELTEMILKITCRKKVKVEKPPANMSKRQRDVWEKLQAGRARDNKKNEVHIYDIINVCMYGGNYFIPRTEIEKMTIWELMNCYNAKLGTKAYEDNFSIGLATGDLKPVSGNKHWHKQLMIRD